MEREYIRVGNEIFPFLEALDIHDATDELQAYARALNGQPLAVTDDEMPVAVLIPVQGMDLEDLSMGTDPNFRDLLERSRRQVRDQGGISSEEIRREFGCRKVEHGAEMTHVASIHILGAGTPTPTMFDCGPAATH